jgi:hypothetical protein
MKINNIIKVFILLSIPIVYLLINWSTKKQLKEKKELYSRSEFFHRMYKEDEFDFIKTGEKELENINNYLESNKDNPSFYFFVATEKKYLIKEIEDKKLYIYSKKDGIKDNPKDFKNYQESYPEQVEKFKNYGKVLNYDKIDYINLYKQKRLVTPEEDVKLIYPENYKKEIN